jgi:hypothetical protein
MSTISNAVIYPLHVQLLIMFAISPFLFIIIPMADNDVSAFPKYQMKIGYHQEQWLPLHEAGRLYDSGYVAVEIGGEVFDNYGQPRPITDDERRQIADIADEWSEDK